MNLPTETLSQLIPKDYVKPDTAVRNYYLKWDEQSYGIPQKEAQELKKFVSEIAQYLTIMYEAAGGIYKTAEEKAGAKEACRIEEAFLPQILATRKRSSFAYNLKMKRDGTTFISRSEIVEGEKKTSLTLNWILGELLFDRRKNA